MIGFFIYLIKTSRREEDEPQNKGDN